jgi:hypothetical protein
MKKGRVHIINLYTRPKKNSNKKFLVGGGNNADIYTRTSMATRL